MTQGYNESSTQIFYGLSSDTKPTGCDNGSIFIEMDTKIGYIYDAANADWTEIPNGGGSQVEMDYNEATNKPAINDVTLSGNKTPASLGLQTKINSDSMLDADLVDDTNSDNKFVSATDIVNWNGKADADDVYTKTYMDTALAGKQPVIDDLSDIRSGAALGTTSLQSSDVKSTYSSAGTDPVNGTAVAAALGTLDVESVGGAGKYISAISETDGKISATAGTMDSTPTTNSTNPITSGGVAASQAEQDAKIENLSEKVSVALGAKLYGYRINKNDINPATRVEYLYDAVGKTPAYMDFNTGTFNYGTWEDDWFIKNNRPVALKFDGTVDYELDHTDFTKKLDGTASDVEDVTYAGNFMSEIPLVWVRRWEDDNYNYVAFSDKQLNENFHAYAHTNANGTVTDAFYAPMFRGFISDNKLRSIMGTNPTGNTTGSAQKTAIEACGSGWQAWDKAKIDLIMDLLVLITKSTNCQKTIGVGDANTYNASDTSTYGKMKSGYETDGTTRSTNAQFYGYEGDDASSGTYGKHHMIAFYIEDLWGNLWNRVWGFNLVDNVYKVKMTPPYALDSDTTYSILSITPPSGEGWLKNVSSGEYGDVPSTIGASSTTGFGDYFYKNATENRLSLFGGRCSSGLRCGRAWDLYFGSANSYWHIGASLCFNKP